MRIAFIIISILILAGASVGFYVTFFVASTEEAAQQERVAFPQAAERVVTESDDSMWYPDRGEGYVEVDYVAPEAKREEQRWEPPSTVTQETVSDEQSFASFLGSLINRFRNERTAPHQLQPSAPRATDDIGVVYEPGDAYRMAGGITRPTLAVSRSVEGECERFNEETGDICIKGKIFNFRTATGNIGALIGEYVGTLIEDTVLGASLGLGLRSNIESGRTLDELGIEIRNGVPYFGGYNSLAEGGIFDGGAGVGAGSSNRFSGYMFSMPCTCRKGIYMSFLVAPASDSGSYAHNLLSLMYQDRGRVGFFRSQGYYHPQASNSCQMRFQNECQILTTTRGTLSIL